MPYTVADIGNDLTPRSRSSELNGYLYHGSNRLPRVLPLNKANSTSPPRSFVSPLTVVTPPPPFGHPFGHSPSFGQSPVLLDDMSRQMQIKPPRRLTPLFSGNNYHSCIAKCQTKCRANHPHASGGTKRRRKNRKQKGTRRHGSRRYRR